MLPAIARTRIRHTQILARSSLSRSPGCLAMPTTAPSTAGVSSTPGLPPTRSDQSLLHFHADGRLLSDAPTGDGSDVYVSDPKKPVRFPTEIRITQGHLWMIEDQRFAATRPDVLVYVGGHAATAIAS